MASTEDKTKKDEKNLKDEKKSEKKEIKEQLVETKHTTTIGGEKIDYTVKTGTLILKKEEEEKEPQAKASIFYIAYIKDNEKPEIRPLTFSFNGGPGSSSVWLHLGLLGPKRVVSEKENSNPVEPERPPYHLIENDYSLLDKTDLGFIDPVSTGYSRAVPGEKNKVFHEFKKDIESVGDFIRLITSRLQRWASPKFLIGESYGTTRAAGLSGYLQDKHGMFLNGIMLVSSILNFQTARFGAGNDLPYLLFLPTYATTAFYHKQLDKQFTSNKDLIDEVKSFAEDEYVPALMKVDLLEGEDKKAIVEKLASFTGLSQIYIEQTNLRIEIHRFCKELLRSKSGKTVGRLDTRFAGIDRDQAGEHPEFDPSYPPIQGAYTSTFNDYVRRELNYENDLLYEILANLYTTWKWEEHQNNFVNVAETLRSAMSKNNHLKVIIANGYYDLATPFYATQYTFNHMQLHPELRKNITMTYYEAGHMMYTHIPSLSKLKQDLATFIEKSK